MDQTVILFLFGALLSIIGGLMIVYIKQLSSRFDSIEKYIKAHDERFIEQDKMHYETRDKIHDLINNEITPLRLEIAQLRSSLK